MEYKCLPENSTTEDSKPSSVMQPFDTIDIEKRAALSSSGYGTIPSYTGKDGLRTPQKEGRGIWISLAQSLVAVGMFTVMAVTLVLVIL